MTGIPSSHPAIAGGDPAKTVPFAREPRYGEEELTELREALAQQSLFYAHGAKVKLLEKEFAEKHGFAHAVATSSGTAAIHAALIAAGISPGDEVILPPVTDMGSVIPVLFQGAVPVFADLDPSSFVLDPASVESCISPRTRAVLAVHLWGNACDMDALGKLCGRKGLVLVEDCAQAFGCTFREAPVGGFGAIGCFSFNEFKHISCGDGGLAVTNDADTAARLRLATDKGYDRTIGAAVRNPDFLANNYRMTELQGAVARAQIRKLDSIVARRRAWCAAFAGRLEGLPGIKLPCPTDGCDPSWWFILLRVTPELKVSADRFAEALVAEGIPATARYIGRCVYEYPLLTNHTPFERGSHPFACRTYRRGLCPVAEDILETAVQLPVNEAFNEQDLEETVFAIRRAAEWFVAGQSMSR